MTQTPMPPAGWYPQGDQERWWDGNQWSDNFRPPQPQPAYGAPPTQVPYGTQPGYGVPYGTPQAPGQYGYQPPARQSHALRNVLLVLGLILVLGVGGCVAVGVVVATKVDSTVNDQTAGGPNVPKTITPGEAFSVKDFDYAAGWSLADDATGDANVTNLTVTNHRDKADYVLVHIDVRQGGTVLATIRCTTSGAKIPQGDTQPLSCFGDQPLPATYDRVTIMDDF